MAKLELNDISSILSNPTGAATAISNNNASIEEALENTLSRDGTSPNQMEANLDMNSKRILNLPSPMYDQEPVRLGDLPDLTGSPIVFEGMNPDVYDPTSVEGDIFDMDNMIQGTVNYFLNASLYNKVNYNVWNVNQFGTTGTADDTAVFQAGIDYINGLGGGTLFIPKGNYVVAGLVGQSLVSLQGEGSNITSLSRKASSSTGVGIITYTSKTNFFIDGINFSGTRSSQTNPANTVTLNTCSHYRVRNCTFFGAKGSSGSYGSGLVVAGGAGASDYFRWITDCRFQSNDTDGLTVSNEWYLNVHRNFAVDNTYQGINLINYVFPPVANKQNQINVSDNHCFGNGKNGIAIVGFYTGGTSSNPIYGPSTPATQFATVTGNLCYDNGNYGIACQGSNVALSNNVASRNGGVSVAYAGILANGQYLSITGNVCYDNSYFGIDAGGSYNSTIVGNNVPLTGVTAANTQCISINVGGCINTIVSGNNIQIGVANGVGINLSGEDGDGTTGFQWYANGNTIVGNHVDLNAQSDAIGVFVTKLALKSKVFNNNVTGALVANQAFRFEVTDIEHYNNTDSYYSDALGSPAPVIASASEIVIPDHINYSIISGTTGITSITTYSRNVWNEKIRGIRLTNRGTGYTSAPTVGFSGGGGTDAAGTAVLANDGSVAYIEMTNYGSGYTSAPTVSITGGGGASAAGTALVGCDNITSRSLDLLFQGSLTVTDGSNLKMPSNFSATADDMLCFRGEYGTTWYEKSRSNN